VLSPGVGTGINAGGRREPDASVRCQHPDVGTPGADPVAEAVRAEALGFDFVSSSDHPGGAAPNYETWTMLCFIAAATSRIRIATRVLGLPYRAPAMVAKMAESLDRLSGGQLILGLGGGSGDDDDEREFSTDGRSDDRGDESEESSVALNPATHRRGRHLPPAAERTSGRSEHVVPRE
jgi:alkanesulfonate monooxygenase SsuD/methylene tetrahydromethanopterin reductase-like flavin-dependent oxidoreductase (luciferase family)